MPEKSPCAHCGTVGFVRQEHVVAAGWSFVEYYCGHCEHTWKVLEENERRAKPRFARRSIQDAPDRSRAS
jgi:hypothetical protein